MFERYDPETFFQQYEENYNGQGHSELPQVKEWKDYLVINEPPEVVPLLSIGDAPVWTESNHSLIIGKKKSRKTLFITYLLSKYEGDMSGVLFADTEQGERHVWKTRDRIYRMTGKHIHILALRGELPERRMKIIEQAIQEGNFKIVIIDGVRDLLSNINDPDQCTVLVTWIERLTKVYNLHMVNVLHQNKVDNNARGHIGSELLNKAEITIDLELDEKANCTIVKCESSRDIPFVSFAFTHDVAGLPELVSMPIQGQALTDIDQKQKLQFVFDGQLIKYKEVIQGIRTHFGVGQSKASNFLGDYMQKGWIVKDGKDKSPDAVYKLMTNVVKPIYEQD